MADKKTVPAGRGPSKGQDEASDLEQMTKWFVSSIGERTAQIEAAILEMDGTNEPSALDSLILSILSWAHSLKGSSGAHQLQWISTACHRLEDEVTKIRHNLVLKNKVNIDVLLRFLDLINKYADELLKNGALDEALYNKRLGLLHVATPQDSVDAASPALLRQRPRVLLVSDSGVMAKQVSAWFKAQGMNHLFHVVPNSQDAIGRLYHETFDILITSLYVTPLDGASLVGALRMSGGFQGLKTILLSTEPPELQFPELGPDHVILKNERMYESLFALLDRLSQAFAPGAPGTGKPAKRTAGVSPLVVTPAAAAKAEKNLKDVVFIDDDLDVLKLARAAFQKLPGVGVRFFTSGSEGLESVLANAPDLVICDYSMPEMTGEQVVLALKEFPDTANVPIAIFTSQASPELDDQLKNMGALGVVDKRIGIQKAIQQIRDLWYAAAQRT